MTPNIRYKPVWLLLCSAALTVACLYWGIFHILASYLEGYGYVSVFFGGMLFASGFTTPFALAFLPELAHNVHPLLGGILGGVGAATIDMLLFRTVREALPNRDRLIHLPIFHWLSVAEEHTFKGFFHRSALWVIAGLVIASPMPDELGASLIGGLTTMDVKKFGVICFLCNGTAIFGILLAARAIG